MTLISEKKKQILKRPFSIMVDPTVLRLNLRAGPLHKCRDLSWASWSLYLICDCLWLQINSAWWHCVQRSSELISRSSDHGMQSQPLDDRARQVINNFSFQVSLAYPNIPLDHCERSGSFP